MSKKRKIQKKFNKLLLPIMAIPLVSLIMYAYQIVYTEEFMALNISDGLGYFDIFAFWKMVAICVLAVYMLISIVLRIDSFTIFREKVYKKIYIALGLYLFFIVLSIIFSEFTNFSLIGMFERFEGGLVFISYLIYVYFTSQVINDEDDLKYIAYSILTGSTIIVTIAFFQALKLDVMTTHFFYNLIGLSQAENISSNFSAGWAYSTLYNPNYLGQYLSLLIPVFAGILVFFNEKKIRIFTGTLIVISIVSLYASHTNSAILGLLLGIVFFALMNLPFVFRHKLLKISFIALVVAGVLLITGAFLGVLGSRIEQFMLDQVGISTGNKEVDDYVLDIQVEKNKVEIETNLYTLKMFVYNAEEPDQFYIFFRDENDEPLNYNINDFIIRFVDKNKDKRFIIRIQNDNTIDFIMKNKFGNFSNFIRFAYSFDEGFLGVIGPNDTIIKEVKPNNMPKNLIGYEKLFSRRLYIWAVTVKNLNDNIIVGDGPDTFRVTFDQFDVLGKVNMEHQPFIVVDKPHNMFLQIAQGTGVLSLIAFLAMLGLYIVWSIKLYWNIDYKRDVKIFGLSITSGIVAFLGSSLFIDSNVSVSPQFYMLLGVGLAINLMINKKNW
ncbi:MAG: O-antigen ligase family protein [Clostridiales bacterium]|nr:O-antigen ligase family protein [Clostridiales bacterium]